MDDLTAYPLLQSYSQQCGDSPEGRLLKLLLQSQPAAFLAGMEVALSRQQSVENAAGNG